MKLLELSLNTPAENLACDEALLDLCEESGEETLRLWESRQHFVVVGYGNKVASEVNVEECRRRSIPILRRSSGGGTVVQGPGCLNYNLTLRIPEHGPLNSVTGTNEFVMERNRAALEKILGVPVSVKGCTDLVFVEKKGNLLSPSLSSVQNGGEGARRAGEEAALNPQPSTLNFLKFSGNAQRRRRHALVFHGTILHAFALSLIDALLRFPSAQPDYRASRSHADFVRNIPASAERIRETLRQAWQAQAPLVHPPSDRIALLVRDQYANETWTWRR